MIFTETDLKGSYIIEPDKEEDDRGFFARTLEKKKFLELGLDIELFQSNISFNKQKGTIRGMHYQKAPYEEVETVSLANIFNSNKISKCNFLKIDCEGAEYDILFKTPKKILQRIDKISMEYHNLDKKRDNISLMNFLKNNGFVIKGTKKFSNSTGMIYAKRYLN